jgi:hypothetical protein
MARMTPKFLRALQSIRTSEVEIGYHCRGCKGYFSNNVPLRRLNRVTCRCGSPDLMLLSVQAEPASPLLRDAHWAAQRGA